MARGGMGELFLAAAGETGGFEKLCVVKKVLHSLEDAAVHRRFLDEAKVVVRLNHANLVQVFDAGRVDNEYYLAMELVEGKDLRAVWNRCAQLHRRIPVDIAIFVIREVLRGLDYVHDALGLDLVHRDISPPNLLVGYRGEVKLTDFGLAKSAIKREMTSPGVVFGRYSYLSPEQARGLPADRRTDIYACAIVLWELLTGRQLFPSGGRSHQEALAAVRTPKVRPPSELVPGIPPGLDDVVLKGLQAERDHRFPSAGEFRAALSEILAREFPTCDADRASEFMREIFARESRTESRELNQVAQRDFSSLRKQGEDSVAISISDVLERGKGGATIELGDADIVELDAPDGRWGDSPPSAKSLRDSAKEWVGRVVAQRYRVDGLIGIGGMGAVFRVTHLALGKPFALKVLHSVYTRDSDIITRFMREARAATQTGHPNIIDVLDIGTTEGGDVYFVMELLDGNNLGAVIHDEGPLAVRRAVHIVRQICRSLAAAHEVGIIHRDLKSENVILTTRGKDPDFVKVLDFGICKHVNADASKTSPGLVMGSPDYMAPEQGAGLEATVASDVYSVGCILFEALTGRMPFEGRNAVDVLMQKGAKDAPRVNAYRPEVPDALADVVARCLRRQPSERPPSMRALEYELTRAIDGRATAVAAVLGLGAGDSDHGPRPSEDPSPAASASMHRAAIAAISGETQIASPSGRHVAVSSSPVPMPNLGTSGPISTSHEVAKPSSSPAVAAVKALFFVALGGMLAGAAVLVLSPETVDKLASTLGLHEEDETADPANDGSSQPARIEPQPKAPVVPEPVPPPEPSAKAEPNPEAGQPEEAETQGGQDTARGDESKGEQESDSPDELDAAGLVALGEAALEKRAWREPAEESLYAALSRLRALEPGNEAIARLRRAAADELMPKGEKALARKRWDEAYEAFRNLELIWPEHPDARGHLIEALIGKNRRQRDKKDYEGALTTAEELLNLQPGEFRWLLLRADLLLALDRFEEAKDAYVEARKVKPRSREVKRGFYKAVRAARREKRRDANGENG